ncbi:MAG: hypothetical protein GY943_35260 [Chloroflexi bacterium]|nr:hypothetical protein [Chloroflexota bacterium]
MSKTCKICRYIPAQKFVETLHTSERLPEQVNQLLVIGGYGLYGSEQLRKCPECGTYYSFLHDHDSESGVGYGYTDEGIVRLDFVAALALIKKTIVSSQKAITYWKAQVEAGNRTHASRFVQSHEAELLQLEVEKRLLQQRGLD